MSASRQGRPTIACGERGAYTAKWAGGIWTCKVRCRDLEGNARGFHAYGTTKQECLDNASAHWAWLQSAVLNRVPRIPANLRQSRREVGA